MKEYKINVLFESEQIITDLKQLVQNDYNTTKLNFTFDKEGRVLFKMLYPDGTQYVDEIQNNELVFGAGILNQEGRYEYEISLYSEDGRLTDYAVKSFEVRSELVNTDELVEPDDRVPVLDSLINEVNTIKQDVEEGKYNGKDGSDGQDGITPTIGENGNWFIDGVDTGMPSRGEQGEKGESGEGGGVSIEEVTAITGNLEDLPTEDKSSLVGAISEVASSGSDLPIYEVVTDVKLNASKNIKLDDTLTSFDNIINNAFKDGRKTITIYLRSKIDTSDCYGGLYTLKESLSTSITSFNFQSVHNRGDGIIRYIVTVEGTWSDNVFTTTNVLYNFLAYGYAKTSDVLTKTNTTSYTPTKDYHPATKKYVDDLVGNINTVLATLTEVSE